MSIAIAHFALGAGVTTLAVAFLLPNVPFPRTVILAGGGWAMVPDFHWVSPVAADRLREIHQSSPLTDLFWFHRTLDALDPGDSKTVAAGFLAFFLAATALAEWRSYRVPEPVAAAYEEHLDVSVER